MKEMIRLNTKLMDIHENIINDEELKTLHLLKVRLHETSFIRGIQRVDGEVVIIYNPEVTNKMNRIDEMIEFRIKQLNYDD